MFTDDAYSLCVLGVLFIQALRFITNLPFYVKVLLAYPNTITPPIKYTANANMRLSCTAKGAFSKKTSDM